MRERIQGELRSQLGRSTRTFRLWQDKEAIAAGKLWQAEIKAAVAQSVFFIPIITPTVVNSEYCYFELEEFLGREAALGRNDLVFPILYIKVPELDDSNRTQTDPVLSIIAKRQFEDWRELRHLDVTSTNVKYAIERYCTHISNALRRTWVSPDERRAQEEIAAVERAEAERKRHEAEAERREKEAQNKAAAAQAREYAVQELRRREAEAEHQRAERLRLQDEVKAKRRAAAEERLRLWRAAARSLWPPSRAVLAAGCIAAAGVVGGIAIWIATKPPPFILPQVHTEAPAPPTALAAASIVPLSPEREQALKPKDTFLECSNCPKMVAVPSGSVTMGSPTSEVGRRDDEGPQHALTIKRFAASSSAVTVDQFAAFVDQTGYRVGTTCQTFEGGRSGQREGRSWRNPGFAQTGSHPAVCLSWNDAKAFVGWLSKETVKDYRLLTEAEYEYAIRAETMPGPAPRYFFGDDDASMCRYGNGADQTAQRTISGAGGWTIFPCSDGYAYTAPVGSFLPNEFGLYDVLGNAASWTEDCYHDGYIGAPVDGTAWLGGDCASRVVRGGSWDDNRAFLRSASRGRYTAVSRSSEVGFRVGRTLMDTPPPSTVITPEQSLAPKTVRTIPFRAPTVVPPTPVGVAPTPSAISALSAVQERTLKPQDTFKECMNCPEMIVVPAGSFTMGSPASELGRHDDEGPQHGVTFARQFAVGRFAVTVDQFSAFVKDTGYDAGSTCWTFETGNWEERQGRSWRNPGFAQTGSHPAGCLNWNDIKSYVAWISKQTGKAYRLLTEAEREYVTRAGSTTIYYFGDDAAALGQYAWYNANSAGQTHPVGEKKPNGFGLYDMHGNVWEWTEDCYRNSYTGASADGSAWTTGDCSGRVVRGGSWLNSPDYLRSAVRSGLTSGNRSDFLGFRVARTLLTP